ncbi:hypothetical protein MANES_15G002020v8 [Manihot esculenta]|uniref:Uncharacterized protein n=1 Tax=Manihot esculenta TaxID=3983 RepID=A0ACB7G9L4_MANES|nr:hypothetical protein MANES_15G002020v8 [Manihot esculenta]
MGMYYVLQGLYSETIFKFFDSGWRVMGIRLQAEVRAIGFIKCPPWPILIGYARWSMPCWSNSNSPTRPISATILFNVIIIIFATLTIYFRNGNGFFLLASEC